MATPQQILAYEQQQLQQPQIQQTQQPQPQQAPRQLTAYEQAAQQQQMQQQMQQQAQQQAAQQYQQQMAIYEQEQAAYKKATALPFFMTIKGKIAMGVILLIVLFLSWQWLKTTALGKILSKLVDFIADIVEKI